MRRLALLCALFVACATPTESKSARHVFGYTPVPGGTSSGGGADPWAAGAQAFVASKVSALNLFKTLPLAQSSNGATKGTNFTACALEGGGYGPVGAVWLPLTEPVFQAPLSGKWGLAFRAQFPAITAAHTTYIGILNVADSHYIVVNTASTTAGHFNLLINGSVSSTTVAFTAVADLAPHDIALIYDGTTLTAYQDGVAQGTAVLASYLGADEPFSVQFNGDTTTSVCTQELTYGFVAPAFASNGSTFSDGTVVPGLVMLDEPFATFDTAKWLAEGNPTQWVGPLQQLTPESGCTVSTNVSVDASGLELAMTANSRGSCAATYPTNVAPYNTTACGGSSCLTNWSPGATTFDTSLVSQKNFAFTCGRTDVKMKMPGGTGPGGDITIWGTNCRTSLGVIDALLRGIFVGGLGTSCAWPQVGSQEFDAANYSHANGITNVTSYVDNSIGGPPFVGAFGNISYYGVRWATPPTGGFQTFLGNPSLSDPSTNFHVYSVEWDCAPNPSWTEFIDGRVVAVASPGNPSWIPSTPGFLQIWNQDTTTVTVGSLPQIATVPWVHIWCPYGRTCTINHVATLTGAPGRFTA